MSKDDDLFNGYGESQSVSFKSEPIDWDEVFHNMMVKCHVICGVCEKNPVAYTYYREEVIQSGSYKFSNMVAYKSTCKQCDKEQKK